MKREIKFRAWIDEETKWSGTEDVGMFTGFSFKNIYAGNDAADVICDDGRLIEEPDWDKIILMQYTGLKDINGKEIYEGDIVEFSFEYYGERYHYITQNGIIKFTGLGFIFWVAEDEAYYFTELNYDSEADIEIIGNIYENPELCHTTN